jgi:RNA polymerase sigma-70 factor, ECF subfamily
MAVELRNPGTRYACEPSLYTQKLPLPHFPCRLSIFPINLVFNLEGIDRNEKSDVRPNMTFLINHLTTDIPQETGDVTSVATLVRLAQGGDRDAFGQLFERYKAGIVALAMRRVRNTHEAEELAQDVFIQAMQKIDQLRVPEAFGGWLRQIVHRMAINRVTRNRVALPLDPESLESTCVAEGTPCEFAQTHEEALAVRDCIDRLGQLDQETLNAFYLQSKSLIEMSDQFDAPIGTIKRRLHVARKRLAKEMDLLQAV